MQNGLPVSIGCKTMRGLRLRNIAFVASGNKECITARSRERGAHAMPNKLRRVQPLLLEQRTRGSARRS